MLALKFRDLLASPVHWFAFGFGSGLSPVAPGTMGTLVALPVYWLMQDLPWLYYAAIVVVMLFAGVWLCGESAKRLQVHDHPGIVWDEIVGYLVTMFMAPSGWIWMLVGFVLFRVFDILKPWPIGWIDAQVRGGWGIMLDDVVAALMAFFLLQILSWAWFPPL